MQQHKEKEAIRFNKELDKKIRDREKSIKEQKLVKK